MYNVLWVMKSHELIGKAKLAKDVCVHAGIRVEEYNNGSKTFGMVEVKLFARLLASKYGIAVHNSLTANSKVFETPTSEDHKIVSWINLLNLNDHILIPSQSRRDFLERIIGVSSGTSVITDKLNHKCIPNCVASQNFRH